MSGYPRCMPCNNHWTQFGAALANLVGSVVYAIGGEQSGYVMSGYKGFRGKSTPIREHVSYVAALATLALEDHTVCAGRLAKRAVSHWVTVPSLPAKDTEHMLHRLVRSAAPGEEVVLVPAQQVAAPRSVDPKHFVVDGALPVGAHVLVVDDTWVSGGHAQSAVLSLRTAGAQSISFLSLARWIKPDFGDCAAFVRTRLTRDFDPTVCPWTGSVCPT